MDCALTFDDDGDVCIHFADNEGCMVTMAVSAEGAFNYAVRFWDDTSAHGHTAVSSSLFDALSKFVPKED